MARVVFEIHIIARIEGDRSRIALARTVRAKALEAPLRTISRDEEWEGLN
ncbi:MAG: hypothetical protein WA979_00565 [Pacificimonas sp.]